MAFFDYKDLETSRQYGIAVDFGHVVSKKTCCSWFVHCPQDYEAGFVLKFAAKPTKRQLRKARKALSTYMENRYGC